MNHDQRWPNLFIVGAAKCGTTSLYHYLNSHPSVFMAARKEPHYFSQIDLHPKLEVLERKITYQDDYLRLFRDAGNARVVGEASTSYLWEPHTARRIRAAVPEAKILILLRDPIQRAYSHYLHSVREAVEDRTFVKAIEDELSASRSDMLFWYRYVDAGRYCDQVRRYLEVFGQEAVLVVFFEDYFRAAAKEMRRVYDFLDIEELPLDSEPKIHNPFGLPRNRLIRRALSSRGARAVARTVIPPSWRWRIKTPLLKSGPKPPLDPTAVGLLTAEYQTEMECLTTLLDRVPPWRSSVSDG